MEVEGCRGEEVFLLVFSKDGGTKGCKMGTGSFGS